MIIRSQEQACLNLLQQRVQTPKEAIRTRNNRLRPS
jgi:hypothetical protein